MDEIKRPKMSVTGRRKEKEVREIGEREREQIERERVQQICYSIVY